MRNMKHITHQYCIQSDTGSKQNYTERLIVGDNYLLVQQGCTNPGCNVARVTIFCAVAPNITGSTVRNWLPVTLLLPRILRKLLDFWKNMCTPAKDNHVPSRKRTVERYFITYNDQQTENYLTNYHTPTSFDTTVSSSGNS